MRGRVKLLPNGPPVPYPVQFRVSGTDPQKLRAYADEVKQVMIDRHQMAARTRIPLSTIGPGRTNPY